MGRSMLTNAADCINCAMKKTDIYGVLCGDVLKKYRDYTNIFR